MTVDVGVGITTNNWNELTISWNNQPGNGTYIGYILNGGFPFYIPLDESDFTNNEITLTLYGKRGEVDGYLAGTSREGAFITSERPHVRFTYEGIDPLIILGITITVIAIPSIIGLIIFLMRRSKKKFQSRMITPPDQLAQTAPDEVSPYKVSKARFCTQCGAQVITETTYCTNCGAKLRN